MSSSVSPKLNASSMSSSAVGSGTSITTRMSNIPPASRTSLCRNRPVLGVVLTATPDMDFLVTDELAVCELCFLHGGLLKT
jgi:hypothetical protein